MDIDADLVIGIVIGIVTGTRGRIAIENEITQSKQSGADGFGNVSARSEFQAVGDLPHSQGAEGWPFAGRLSHPPPAPHFKP